MPKRTKNNFASNLNQSAAAARLAPVLRFPGTGRDFYNSSSDVRVRLNQTSNCDFLDEQWSEEEISTKIRLVDDTRFVSQNDSSLTDEADLSELEPCMEEPVEVKAFIRKHDLGASARMIFEKLNKRMPDNKIALKLYDKDLVDKVGIFVSVKADDDIEEQVKKYNEVTEELFVNSESLDGLPVFSILDFSGVV